jgi:hypothetical protein
MQAGDQQLMRQINTQKTGYESIQLSLRKREKMDQIEVHRRRAKYLMESGIMSKIPEAVSHLQQAIDLARSIGADGLLKPLERDIREYSSKEKDSRER